MNKILSLIDRKKRITGKIGEMKAKYVIMLVSKQDQEYIWVGQESDYAREDNTTGRHAIVIML